MQGCVKGTVLVSSLTLHNTIKAACAVLSADNDFLKVLLKKPDRSRSGFQLSNNHFFNFFHGISSVNEFHILLKFHVQYDLN